MEAKAEHVELEVGGMTCQGCVRTVEKRLKSLAGVNAAAVDLQANLARVEYRTGHATPAEMASAIEKLGFSARVK